ncbi:vezatin family protein [Aspergillus clavatus NRRL 1]|uniref:Vezatin n=1 Tax=Aspergillus clavatus (strain ATCC 1007 / CBS 513.65 / DSM 816 / NCTC 3887 / NRRL 1 / QM 1276 / 107) TaxID=344612 RepID=A1CRH2_ASPCL|nr:uncharacterized protein ACLA_029730 [Aspergillus clavatus NRRL 1]EAW08243.1 conserved hypothetical protein [Aspergillus clavatus NRRL 1]
MEALVYENSPLAEYLKGEIYRKGFSMLRSLNNAIVGHSGEGEYDADWPAQETDNTDDPFHSTPSEFAPRGTSTFQERVRNRLPKPLELKSSRQGAVLGKLYGACSAALNSRLGRNDNERFLEQFGYVIVASQLLNEHSAPSYTSAADVLSNSHLADLPSLSTTFGVQGAVVTASTSFSIAWLLHWSRSRTGSGFNPRKVGVLLVLVPVLGVLFYAFARRQWLKYLRHQAVEAAVVFISNAQGFDSAASASVVFIQEVELVSRGYRISTPLPPVSRLEDQAQTRRCLRLRRTVSECFYSMLARYLQAQRTLQPLTDNDNLAKYHDIYDVSLEELAEAATALADRETEDQYSLRALRTLFGRLYTVRKSILCCLLALGADGGGSDIARWSTAIEQMRDLAQVTGANVQKMTNILNEEDRDAIPPSPLPTASPNKENLRAQYRKLNTLTQGIRALHAKMHLIRELSTSNPESADSGELEAALLSQYESIGTDIRGLLQEWEAGKSALMNSIDKRSSVDHLSRPPSALKIPLSPTPSLGGVTAVEGSPSDALRALNGELRPDPSIVQSMDDDEEIFESIALPARNKRASLTREERIARVKEDRAKQAAARDRVDANTSMLKELEMVIKQRPRVTASKRVTSI